MASEQTSEDEKWVREREWSVEPRAAEPMSRYGWWSIRVDTHGIGWGPDAPRAWSDARQRIEAAIAKADPAEPGIMLDEKLRRARALVPAGAQRASLPELSVTGKQFSISGLCEREDQLLASLTREAELRAQNTALESHLRAVEDALGHNPMWGYGAGITAQKLRAQLNRVQTRAETAEASLTISKNEIVDLLASKRYAESLDSVNAKTFAAQAERLKQAEELLRTFIPRLSHE